MALTPKRICLLWQADFIYVEIIFRGHVWSYSGQHHSVGGIVKLNLAFKVNRLTQCELLKRVSKESSNGHGLEVIERL